MLPSEGKGREFESRQARHFPYFLKGYTMSKEWDEEEWDEEDDSAFEQHRNMNIIARLANIRQQIRLKARSAEARAESYKNQTQPTSFQEHQEDVLK